MKFKFCHNNFNVVNLEKSLEFYNKALGLVETKRTIADDGSFILVFLSDGESTHKLELTWLRDWDRQYNLGDNEFHIAFRVENFDDAYNLHKEMGCICYENKEMGIYFIQDPDNYWIEILPVKY